jgi:hypothetical protein
LAAGDEHAGGVAADFQDALGIKPDNLAKIQQELREKAVKALDRWVEYATSQPGELPKDVRKSIVDIVNAINKAPTINIGSVSYSRGLTPEDMKSEFSRLTGVAGAAFKRRAISSPIEG